MKIGELAKKTKVCVDTVRYYEKRQLLLQPKRTSSGYRTYTEQDVKRLLFIVQAKTLGFTLEEIKLLLSLQLGQIDCAEVRKIA
ncbi:MAG: MerR family transcriptional regulator [Ghiorsea sp.]|nr:MerR family transcriptional regulator [Ghiorsea sp.]